MASQPTTVDAAFYAVIKPNWHPYLTDSAGRPVLEGATVERITKNVPQTVRGEAFVTRLTLRIDADALLPLQPQAVVHISADQGAMVIETSAEAPEAGA